MSPDAVETYKDLLEKELKVDDKYVVIDVKWLKQWKRFVGIDKTDQEQVNEPGSIDFENLTDRTTVNPLNEVQLRSSAVEGNDYTFIPYELYQDLVQKYGKTGRPIIRRVVRQGPYQNIIETFLIPLRLRVSSSADAKVKQIYRSRRTRIDEIQKEICNEFDIPYSSIYRLYSSLDDQGQRWEPLNERPESTLEDIILIQNAFIIYEHRTPSTLSTHSSYPGQIKYTRGLCGLLNLGNTCFMNSALQCLSNVPALTDYFLRNEYENYINSDNPLGMKGEVARAYGELIREMWSGTTDYCAPKLLKQRVATYAPQFSGFSQQDSQEFMSFVLDGLHEDLNQVKVKPYIEKKDDDGITEDAIFANEEWDSYLKRNQSKIQEIFHGQIKSLVQCLTCGTTGRTFDPICFLSLPLPVKANIRTFKIDYVRLNGQIKTYRIKCDEQGQVSNLIRKFCDCFEEKKKEVHVNGSIASNDNEQEDKEEQEQEQDFTKDEDYDGHNPRPDRIYAVEVFNNRIYTEYRKNSPLDNILKNDKIVFHEIPDPSDNEKILVPCLFREKNYSSLFGLPIYISVPKYNCKGSDIQKELQKRISHFLPLPSETSSDQAFYTTSMGTDGSYSKPISIESSLDEYITLVNTNRVITIDVESSIVDEYKRRSQKEPASPMTPGIPTQNQSKPKITLSDCLKCFTKKEVLSDDDLWRCPKCKDFKKASKKIDLWLLPKVLIVQMKRFSYTRYFRDKIDLLVDCPIRDLDLSPFVLNSTEKSNAKYDLIAVSNHSGYLGGGHYTAYAKNSTDRKWHSFNDSFVSDASESSIVCEEAYVLIYQKQE